MSRSNPHDNAPNPAARWFEWNGEKGLVRYYDKEAKRNVEIGDNFTFLLLDELASVRGWHEPSQSGIYSNEVRDTRRNMFVVKAFKAPAPLAEGFYKDIKDRAHSVGGQFVANCYIAFKNGGDGLAIGSIKFKGAALSAWMEFKKANRGDLYKKAVQIQGYVEGKKGRVIYRVPTFKLADLSEETNRIAVALDAELQAWLKSYLARNTREQVEAAPPDTDSAPPDYEGPEPSHPVDDDAIPF